MERLAPNQVLIMFISLGVLLTAARLLGEIARKLNQPVVLGEILAGILLGPTVFGKLAPITFSLIFPRYGANALVLDGLVTLAVVLFLLVAGMELDLSTVWRQGRIASVVSLAGMLVPFLLGFSTAVAFPGLLGADEAADPMIFSLFFATALSISALPVIAKILIDLNLYRSDLGMIIMASAIFNDLAGWIVFAIILGMIGNGASHGLPIGTIIGLTLAFAILMLTVGRWLIHRLLPWLQAYASWPGGILGFCLSLALLGAAFTEWVGVHALFGSFIVGVAIGDSNHLREQTRNTINQFVSFIFAPLFFASIGLRVDFLSHLDFPLIIIVFLIACLGKVVGCGLGARLAGVPSREAWAIGFGMNARGAMEIILGMLALQYKVINEKMFVALVIMALLTSLMSGPFIQRLLKSEKARKFDDFLTGKTFIAKMKSNRRQNAIRELADTLGAITGLDGQHLARVAWEREKMMSTGLGNGIALPHARIGELAAPVVAVGLSPQGIDFDAPDGEPARMIFLILTPKLDSGAQIEIIADIARTFSKPEIREQVLQVTNYTEFRALMKSEAVISAVK